MITPGNPNMRQYSEQKKEAAVRMARQLCKELGTCYDTVKRVATQSGYGVESVRLWARQADINEGHTPVVDTEQPAREKALEPEWPGIERFPHVQSLSRHMSHAR